MLTYSHEVSGVLNEQAVRGAGDQPAQRLSSFLDRCLPSDKQLADEWLLWQELALLCIRQPELAKVGAALYEDFYSTVTEIITERHRDRGLPPAIDSRKIAETAVALCDGLGARVVANDPHLTLDEARATIAATVGMLVGHDGPLPKPTSLLAGLTHEPIRAVDHPPQLPARRPGPRCGVALPGCAYIRDDVPVAAPLPKSAKAEIDGDLVYFNWADYLDPSIFKGFQKEYGVKIIQSNFDSMEGMYAKIAAGNQYDIVFPIAKWVVKMRREGKLRAIDPDQLENAEQVFYPGSYFNDPWYDPKSRVSVPFTVYKTGIGWRTDKVSAMTGSWRDLWNPEGAGHIFTLDDQDEALAMAALLLGYDVNTAKRRTSKR